jgi:hypothetical protein
MNDMQKRIVALLMQRDYPRRQLITLVAGYYHKPAVNDVLNCLEEISEAGIIQSVEVNGADVVSLQDAALLAAHNAIDELFTSRIAYTTCDETKST